jgi:hypothetical protein
MATATTDAPPKAKATMLDRIGAGGSVLSVLALAVPVVYTVYANSNTVTLNTSDDVKNLITNGIIVTGVAGVIGLIATVLNVPGLLKMLSVGRIAATGVSALMLIASVLFLVLGLLPRVSPLNHLNNDLQPFGNSLTTNCATPLNQTNSDLNQIYIKAGMSLTGDATGDGIFAQEVPAELTTLQGDATALTNGVAALGKITTPSPYQDLLNRCVRDLKSEAAFLSDDHAIPLPAPFSAVAPSVSFEHLLGAAAGVISGQVQIPGVPAAAIQPGTFQGYVRAVLKGDATLGVPSYRAALCQSDAQLTAEAAQLYNEAVTTLKTNTAPFKANVDAIIGTNTPSLNYCSAK